jgi:hypothetical protein
MKGCIDKLGTGICCGGSESTGNNLAIIKTKIEREKYQQILVSKSFPLDHRIQNSVELQRSIAE